jgi:hypothetical protein
MNQQLMDRLSVSTLVSSLLFVSFLGLHLVEQCVQSQEVLFPGLAVLFEPSLGIRQRFPLDPTDMCSPHDSPAHQSSSLQDSDVLGCSRKGHPQRDGQLTQVLLARRQIPQDRPPRGVGQRVENSVQFRGNI